MKVPAKVLPPKLKSALKEYGFAKREIGVKINTSAKVYGNNHKPEYDNFDYSYAISVDLNNGTIHNQQTGLGPNEDKTVNLSKHEVLIDGDKHAHFASLTMNQETFDKYIQPYLQQEAKVAMKKVYAEIQQLERRLTAGNYLEQLEQGMKQVKDALKHLEKDETTRRMLQEVEHLEKDYNTYMIKVMDTVEPL